MHKNILTLRRRMLCHCTIDTEEGRGPEHAEATLFSKRFTRLSGKTSYRFSLSRLGHSREMRPENPQLKHALWGTTLAPCSGTGACFTDAGPGGIIWDCSASRCPGSGGSTFCGRPGAGWTIFPGTKG